MRLTSLLPLVFLLYSFHLFGQVTGQEPSSLPAKFILADINLDGKQELLTAEDKKLKVFERNNFELTLLAQIAIPHNIKNFSACDVNNDGYPEIMMNTSSYVFYYNNEAGVLKSSKVHLDHIGFGGTDFISYHTHDLDNDGDQDILLLRDDTRFFIIENINGVFNAGEKKEICNLNTEAGSEVKFCDYNQDGNMDIIFHQGYLGVHILTNTGHMDYSLRKLSNQSHSEDFVITDFNLDGYPDIVNSFRTPYSSSPGGYINVYMNSTTECCVFYSIQDLWYPQTMETENIDDDPFTEILVSDDQSLAVLDFENGIFTREVIWGTPDSVFIPNSSSLTVMDFTNDSKLEVIHTVYQGESTLLLTDYDVPVEQKYSCSQPNSPTLCPSGDVHIQNKSELDLFGVNYPHCTYLNGSLFIEGSVTDLAGVSHIRSVNGSLLIDNTQLASIDEVDLITVRDDVRISQNFMLTEIDLEHLQIIGGHLEISNNASLLKISSGEKLEKLISVEISDNPLLESINGFSKARDVSPLSFINNPSLDSLNAFQSVVGGNVYLENSPCIYMKGFGLSDTIVIMNSVYPDLKPFNSIKPDYLRLENIRGLSQISHLTQGPNDRMGFSIRNCDDLVKIELPLKLRHVELSGNENLVDISSFDIANTVARDIIIQNNPKLIDLDGLEYPSKLVGKILIDNNASLSSIDALVVGDSRPIDTFSITHNPKLNVCDIELVCDLLWGSIPHTIFGNDDGCLNGSVVLASCGITASEQMPVEKVEIFIYPNPALDVLYVKTSTCPQQIIVFSIDGQDLVHEVNSEKVSLRDLSSGMYFLKVILKDQTLFYTFSIPQ